jgi:hypothetical protein
MVAIDFTSAAPCDFSGGQIIDELAWAQAG